MYTIKPGWQSPSAHRTGARTVHFDLRDRVKPYAKWKENANSPSLLDLNPTDAFFGASSAFANQHATRQFPICRVQKHRQVQNEPEEQQGQQEQRSSLTDLQSTRSPLTRELLDRVFMNSDNIYDDALSRISGLHRELANIIAETNAEDDRILGLLENNQRKTIKPPSDTRIGDVRNDGEIQVGERVVFVKDRIDTVEAEVASLWDQWESAQREVDEILASVRVTEGTHQTGLVVSVQESLAGEMTKFTEELTSILEDAYEEARASEKIFSKKVNSVMSSLLQQYLLED